MQSELAWMEMIKCAECHPNEARGCRQSVSNGDMIGTPRDRRCCHTSGFVSRQWCSSIVWQPGPIMVMSGGETDCGLRRGNISPDGWSGEVMLHWQAVIHASTIGKKLHLAAASTVWGQIHYGCKFIMDVSAARSLADTIVRPFSPCSWTGVLFWNPVIRAELYFHDVLWYHWVSVLHANDVTTCHNTYIHHI